MSTPVDRKPVLGPPSHPADSIPPREAIVPSPPPPDRDPGGPQTERLTEQHNVRIRPSVRKRLEKAVLKMSFESGDRTLSMARITDDALDAYLKQRGL